ncbi:MAG TPA: DinB family protein [Ilumatobacteraceae bacterium]
MPGQVAPIDDERELLLAYIAQQRDGLKYAAYGLTDDQARLTPTAGTLSIGGLVKHVTAMERTWLDLIRQSGTSDGADYEDGFTLRPDETLAGALAALAAVAAETEATVRATDLSAAVPVPQGVPWFPDDVDAWSVRWVLLHMVEEIARHAGHADIVRESIDGATMHPLMAAAEGWPATEWLQPWTARGDAEV